MSQVGPTQEACQIWRRLADETSITWKNVYPTDQNLTAWLLHRLMFVSGYLSKRLPNKIVRGPIDGNTPLQTGGTGRFWHQRLLSACSSRLQETLKLKIQNNPIFINTRLVVTPRPSRVFLFRLVPCNPTGARLNSDPTATVSRAAKHAQN